MSEYISLPSGYSFEWPSYNLVMNVSPFPVFKCFKLAESPHVVPEDFVWIKIKPRKFGLYRRGPLMSFRCPLCGRPFDDQFDGKEE